MEQKIKNTEYPYSSQEPEIISDQESVKASHLSSNPINGKPEIHSNNGMAHFEVEVEKAFFRIFFGC